MVAATDAAMTRTYLATHWIVSTKSNDREIVGGLESTRWNDGLIPSGEGVGLLELITKITQATHNVNQGEICIYNNNKKLLREIDKRRKKESNCTQEAGAVVIAIRRELERASIDIKLEYVNNKPRANLPFEL